MVALLCLGVLPVSGAVAVAEATGGPALGVRVETAESEAEDRPPLGIETAGGPEPHGRMQHRAPEAKTYPI